MPPLIVTSFGKFCFQNLLQRLGFKAKFSKPLCFAYRTSLFQTPSSCPLVHSHLLLPGSSLSPNSTLSWQISRSSKAYVMCVCSVFPERSKTANSNMSFGRNFFAQGQRCEMSQITQRKLCKIFD